MREWVRTVGFHKEKVMRLEDKYLSFLHKLPGVKSPLGKLTFKDKLKWTGLMLLAYFLMSQVMVFGSGSSGSDSLQFLQIVLGSEFGSLITLGIGPIVTASIILQLLVGSKIIPWNTREERGRDLFQGTQKVLAILFAFLEAYVFVSFGAVHSDPGLQGLVILQLAIGGVIVLFMDEVISKWGFGSGIGLFIVAGVSKGIVIGMFNPLTAACIPGDIATCLPDVNNPPSGGLPFGIFTVATDPVQAFLSGFLPVIATILVFVFVVYSQAIRVEVPLSFGMASGFGRRWPLKFFYTSNMPVILVAALLANVQLMSRVLAGKVPGFIGTFDPTGRPIGGLIYYLFPPRSQALASLLVTIGIFVLIGVVIAFFMKRRRSTLKTWKLGALFGIIGGVIWYLMVLNSGITSLLVITVDDILQLITYTAFMVVGSVIFSKFWVSTSGMDARSVAEQIDDSGMYIAGMRRDVRIIENVLNKYIPTLTVVGGAAVGMLAAFADFTFAIGTGTGILLASMIIYQLYEEIKYQHKDDMPAPLRRFIGD